MFCQKFDLGLKVLEIDVLRIVGVLLRSQLVKLLVLALEILKIIVRGRKKEWCHDEDCKKSNDITSFCFEIGHNCNLQNHS